VELQKLQDQLFKTKQKVYSVIDGATLPALLGKLEDHKGESTCLFRGELPFDLAEAAPYLVSLKKDDLPVTTPENNVTLFQKVSTYLMLSETYDELLSFKKPHVNQNKEDYKNNIEAGKTLETSAEVEEVIEIEEPNKMFDEEKTMIARSSRIEEKPFVIPSPSHPAMISEDEEIDLDKTVFMPRKPK